MRVVFSIAFLFILQTSVAQSADTLLTPYAEGYDSLYEYNTYDDDSLYSAATYTYKPGELPVTQHNRTESYKKKKFSKTEWKEIIGETSYTEEKIEQQESRVVSGAWNPVTLKIIGYSIIILLIIVLIVFLLRTALADDPLVKKITTADSLLAGDQHIDDIGELDLEKLLRQALEKKDLRTAIRLYYIKLLKHLHSAGYIAWKKNKTNRDYASELSASAFIREFRKVMVAYEVIWYGERTPSEQEFETLQVNFTELHRQSPDQPHEK